MSTGTNGFAMFMAGPVGRGVRIVAGLVLLVWGFPMRASTTGMVVMAIGLVALLAGALNVCLIAPIIGAPFLGKDARRGT